MTGSAHLVSLLPWHHCSAASNGARAIDRSLQVALGVGGALFGLFVLALVVALVQRRRASKRAVSAAAFSALGPALGCAGSLGIVAVLFWLGYVPYLDALVAPGDAYEIQAVSQRGAWTFSYPSGKTSLNKLVVPNQRAIRLVLSSTDVAHGFYVPQLRTQRTAIPGRYCSLWFNVESVQELSVLCTEDCPSSSSASSAKIAVVDAARFDEWLASKEPAPGASAMQ